MNDRARTQISGLRTVGVPVADQDRALEFYVGALGFDKRLDAPYGSGGRWVEVAPPGSAVTIALVRSSEHVPAGVETGIRLTSADADADQPRLGAAEPAAGRGGCSRQALRCGLSGHPCIRVPGLAGVA